MSSKIVIVYNRKNSESVKDKFNAKKANPYATIVESSDKEALKKALKGKNKVINCDPKLDKRHLKLDVVINREKNAEAAAKNKVVAEAKAKEDAEAKEKEDKEKKEAVEDKKKEAEAKNKLAEESKKKEAESKKSEAEAKKKEAAPKKKAASKKK